MKSHIHFRTFWLALCLTLLIALTGFFLLAAYDQMASFAHGSTILEQTTEEQIYFGGESYSFSANGFFQTLNQLKKAISVFPPAELLVWIYDRAADMIISFVS